MRCKDYSVTQIRIDMHLVGIVGLDDALRAVDAAGAEERRAVEDLLLESLAARNYIPDTQRDAYRRALWREFLRHRGRDFSELFDEVPVTVRGPADDRRDRFASLLREVFAEFELRPVVTYSPDSDGAPTPQLELGGQTIARGMPTQRSLRSAVYQSFSDW